MENMKMSDVFKLPMVCEDGDGFIYSNDLRYSIQFDDSDTYMMDHKKAVTHAINNHDRLVEENAELRELVKSYKLAADEATKYKHALSYNKSYTGEPNGELKNNLAELDMVSCKALKFSKQIRANGNA